MKDFDGKLVLITGGSSGIGLALAKKMAVLGANVWILSRSPSRLEMALAQVRQSAARTGQAFGVLKCDITQPHAVDEALGSFIAEHGVPDLVVNSAGYSYPQTFLNIPPEIFTDQMDVNYFGTVNVIRAVLPGMLARGCGHIVNLCSTAGLLTFYGFTAYSASKFALRGFTDALRSEIRGSGVDISLCFPPDTDTPGLQTENEVKPEVTRIVSNAGGLASPEQVADSIVRGIRRNQYLILSGVMNKLIYALVGMLGKLTYPVMDAMVSSAKQQARKNGKPC